MAVAIGHQAYASAVARARRLRIPTGQPRRWKSLLLLTYVEENPVRMRMCICRRVALIRRLQRTAKATQRYDSEIDSLENL